MEHGKRYGVDARAIGKGAYDLLKENDRAVVAFGMSPKWLMDDIEKRIRQKLGRIYLESTGDTDPDPEVAEMFGNAVYKDTMAEIMTGVHLGLLDAAKEHGALVV